MTKLQKAYYRAYRKRSLLTWFERILSWAIVILAMVTLTFAAFILVGCTALTYEQQRELALQGKGCYCQGKNCDEIKSAAGSAAVAAAGGQVVNITKVEKPQR